MKGYLGTDVQDCQAEACRSDDILSVLVSIQQHLNEAHALCDAIHGPMPRTRERENVKKSDDSVIFLMEERTRLIEFDSSELLPRLRDIGNRLGQVK